MILYHATLKQNLDSIFEKGLIPQIGKRSEKTGENPGVFLFSTYEDCSNALTNWLGEEFDEVEPYQEAYSLEINLPDDFPLENSVDYEKISRHSIPAKYIKIFKCEG